MNISKDTAEDLLKRALGRMPELGKIGNITSGELDLGNESRLDYTQILSGNGDVSTHARFKSHQYLVTVGLDVSGAGQAKPSVEIRVASSAGGYMDPRNEAEERVAYDTFWRAIQ
jgi:hypothetical protein